MCGKKATIRMRDRLHDTLVSERSMYTDQEIRVAELSVQGKSDNEIAHILKTKPECVRDMKETLIAKVRANMKGC
jgi:DNA-binding NarL/FixJ family response regulator